MFDTAAITTQILQLTTKIYSSHLVLIIVLFDKLFVIASNIFTIKNR